MNRKRKNTPGKSLQPKMEWQTGEFSRQASFSFLLPYQFLLLCKLVNVTPSEIISQFMNNLSFGSWQSEGRVRARQMLLEYFLESGYGQDIYSAEELRIIFAEMNSIGMLYPTDADAEMIDLHAQWRDAYHHYWFNKWRVRQHRK